VRWLRALLPLGFALVIVASACEPEVVVGSWPCAEAPRIAEAGAAGAGGEAPTSRTAIEVPWSTSFEDGFCGYSDTRGFCYGDPGTRYELSNSRVHSGRVAAEFRASTHAGEQDTRCVREGVLPDKAYYGAWFFVPAARTNGGNWNLMHFQGSNDTVFHGTWDVSLESTDSGSLYLYVFDFAQMKRRFSDVAAEVPIATWFRIVFYLERAADATGQVALFQDGRELLRLKNIATDDSSWGQWYVGSLASSLMPPDATVYVDDVSIDTKL